MITALQTLAAAQAGEPLVWRIATIVVIAACLLIILGAAVALFYTFVYEPLDADDEADLDPYERARLDLASRVHSHKEQ